MSARDPTAGDSTAGPELGPGYARTAPVPPLTRTQRAMLDHILATDAPGDYEPVSCPCGAAGPDRVLSEVDRHGLPCRNVVCAACGLIRLTPRWREDRYRHFYEREYRSLYNPTAAPKPQYARAVETSPATRERGRWIRDVRARLGGGGETCVVEIGAGGGWNLGALPDHWTRIGYDVDEEYLVIGREAFGVDMRRGLLAEALPAVPGGDLILLSHVLEHLPDPAAALQMLAGAMRGDACLLIEVPGIFRLHRSNLDPRSYLQNAHTFTFCAATLRDACGRAGLEVVELDETARVVCRPGGSPAPVAAGRPALAGRIVTYLKRCDAGFRRYRRLRAVPGLGRVLASVWRRTYFAALGALTSVPD